MSNHMSTTSHLDRLAAARRRCLSEDNVAALVEPTRTFPTHLVTSPYFFVGPHRPHPLDAIRLVCNREQRLPRRDEVVSVGGTTTRVLAVTREPRGRAASVTFTCHGAEDGARSAGLVRDYGDHDRIPNG